jgi:homoserine dehydrogenase
MSAPAITAVRDASHYSTAPARPITIALLGLGRIGSAVARRAREDRASPQPLRVVGALVRDVTMARPGAEEIPRTTDVAELFARRPDVVVEVLGDIEAARTLIRGALERRVPVVTANKALMARHGEELLGLAIRTGTAFRYEASVLAGVPFLGTFSARPLASRVTALSGILNGTTNFVLSQMRDTGAGLVETTLDAQRRGFAEPDPSQDISGNDAAHKLAILAWHFGLGSIAPEAIETIGIDGIDTDDVTAADQFAGVIRPVARIEQSGEGTTAFVGPAFLPRTDRLAQVDGVENALVLETDAGRLFFSGPGAGPIPTATTILDDVIEATRGGQPHAPVNRRGRVPVGPPATSWFLRLTARRLPPGDEIVGFLGSYGIWSHRTLTRGQGIWLLTYPCTRDRVEMALCALSAATPCDGYAIRALVEH